MLNPFLSKMNPSPFLNKTFTYYGNNDLSFSDEEDNELITLNHNNNNFLMNYQNMRSDEMALEKKSYNNLYSIYTKNAMLKNLKKENNKKYLNALNRTNNEINIINEKYSSKIENNINKKMNEIQKIKNENIILSKKKDNLIELKNKKREEKLIRKRNKQKKIINDLENKARIELMKYEKNKKMLKEKKEKEFLLKKNQFKIKTKLKINDLKNKSELVSKLSHYFDNSK